MTTVLRTTGMMIVLVSAFAFGQLSGTKTVGAAGDYPTLAAAIAALNASGVNGATTFSLIDNSYSETGANLLIKVTTNAPTATNTVTFKPAIGISPVVTVTGCSSSAGSNLYCGFTDSCTSYLTIDGSNSVGGTSRDLTFTLNDATNGRTFFNIYGNCDFITIKNAKFLATAYYSTPSAGSPTMTLSVIGQSTGVADNLTIDNNQIADASVSALYGITVQGYSTGSVACTNVITKANLVTSQWRGIHYFWVASTGNTSEIFGNQVSTLAPNIGFNTWAIFLRTCGGTLNIYNNKFVTIKNNTNTSSSVLYGIQTSTAVAGGVVNIYNNFFGDFYCMTATGAGASILSFGDAGTYNVYHNTILVSPINNVATTVAAVKTSSTGNLTLKNNIIVNSYNIAAAYGIYWGSSGTLVSNYNNISIPTASGKVGNFSTTDAQTLAAWQSASSNDANSKSVAVTFASSTDLHLASGSIGDLNLAGVSGLGITTDIDGDSRYAAFPYMGADEVVASPLPVELTSFTGKSHTGIVELAWTTANEIDNYGFEIERREKQLSASAPWQRAGFIEGNGTSNAPKNYAFVDKNIATGTYSYRLKQIDRNGSFKYSSQIEIAVNGEATTYALSGNYPNPFNPNTIITFQLPHAVHVSLKVYDVLGKEVATLVNEVQNVGNHAVSFDASGLPSGVYMCTLQAGSFTETKKMILMK